MDSTSWYSQCRFQDFYAGGEREAMADEISNLRDQVQEFFWVDVEK